MGELNGDSLIIMNAIGEMRADLQKQIGHLDAKVSDVLGDHGARIKNLETAESRGFWVDTIKACIPAGSFVGLHIILHKLGWKI